MIVESPLPIAASVIATSGAASNKYNTEAIRLTIPAEIIAVVIFFVTKADMLPAITNNPKKIVANNDIIFIRY